MQKPPNFTEEEMSHARDDHIARQQDVEVKKIIPPLRQQLENCNGDHKKCLRLSLKQTPYCKKCQQV